MSVLKIYNTLSGKKDSIKPLKGKKINLFVCGPTVYDFLHIGNARVYVIFDSFVKFLKHQGFSVFYLQNITDIDDKIILRAKEKGVSPKDLAKAFAAEYVKEMKILQVNSVNKYAKATNYISQIINQVKRLYEAGYAYQLKDGIYFDISKFKNYGKLSGRSSLQAEDAVSRIDYSKDKRNRGDFCLWKYEVEGETSWSSPFGRGRPGWHIEDTAITEKFFGDQYDIHGGGIDLIFPHHEAEITQMESISKKKPLVKYWMHIGFLTTQGQKMAKSDGNMLTIHDFLKRYSSYQLRFLLLKNLWRAPLDFSESTMIEVNSTLEKIEEFLKKIKNNKIKTKQNIKFVADFKNQFYDALNDDFNTPKALSIIFDFIKTTNTSLDKNVLSEKASKEIYKIFQEINDIFSFINFQKINESLPTIVKKLLKERKEARKKQDWQKADFLRMEIEKQGYTVEDLKEGVIVKRR